MSRRPARRTTALAAAAALASTLLAGSPAQALEPDWQQTVTRPDGQPARVVSLATSPQGRSYVLSSDDVRERAQLTALDTATGAPAWTIPDGLGFAGSSAPMAVDPGTGAAVLVTGTAGSPFVDLVTSVASDGSVRWSQEQPRGFAFDQLVVDERSGTVCGSGSKGDLSRWALACWSREGELLSRGTVGAPGEGYDLAGMRIDSRRERVYVAGARAVGPRGAVRTVGVLVALSFSGKQLWRRTIGLGARRGAVLDLAVDRSAGRVHLLAQNPSRAMLVGFRADGRRAYADRFGRTSGDRPRARWVDVLPGSRRVAVSSQRPSNGLTSVRISAPGGRRLATRTLDVCCELARPVVDPARDRLVLATGARGSASRDEGGRVSVVDARGRVLLDEQVLPAGSRARLVGPAYDEVSGVLLLGTSAPTGDDVPTGWVAGLGLP